MWARVKGKTENDLLKLPFKAAYMFRPAGIQPLHGVGSKTALDQRRLRASPRRCCRWLRKATPGNMTTSEQLGRAMIKVATRRLSEADAGKRGHQQRRLIATLPLCGGWPAAGRPGGVPRGVLNPQPCLGTPTRPPLRNAAHRAARPTLRHGGGIADRWPNPPSHQIAANPVAFAIGRRLAYSCALQHKRESAWIAFASSAAASSTAPFRSRAPRTPRCR